MKKYNNQTPASNTGTSARKNDLGKAGRGLLPLEAVAKSVHDE